VFISCWWGEFKFGFGFSPVEVAPGLAFAASASAFPWLRLLSNERGKEATLKRNEAQAGDAAEVSGITGAQTIQQFQRACPDDEVG
jgi:hypothetical protein